MWQCLPRWQMWQWPRPMMLIMSMWRCRTTWSTLLRPVLGRDPLLEEERVGGVCDIQESFPAITAARGRIRTQPSPTFSATTHVSC